ncbi:PIN domain-containing protein [Rhizobiaceae bacterium n13]|uniref:PIN domain-containing protein n=1 Tax=Ferirhizobium litorale TaxID=2927786 RepID=A0AAE3QD90_9HYPH|nr:PIN domain-containing protein [Fererhizobium litorale]MDI7860946.1 PIN domain-containing protein [Fererhizobium litorale]MDI7921094.1 PIN domain-containing protein [Fererhizobium litorale]
MRDLFPGFYPPSDKEYQTISKEALVVFDTNSLLDLYRLPANARDEFLEVLAGLKDRLWIPFQVALEFQRNRLAVMADERKVSQEALDSAKHLVDALTKKVQDLELDKHGLGLKPDELLKDLNSSSEKLRDALTAVHDARIDPGQSDEIRDRLDKILQGKVGDPPSSQDDLNNLTKDGEERYASRIPPGYCDSDKEKDPKKASYVYNGIKYAAKFGDLILWRQLINYIKIKNVKSVLLVTRDKKDDWWWEEKGKTLGPSPELIAEIKREAAVEIFWMYRPDQFLEMAKDHSIAKVSNSSVDDLKALKNREWRIDFTSWITEPARPLTESRIEDIVLAYLETRFDKVEVNSNGFPDAFAFSAESKLAVEVKSPGKEGPTEYLERAKSAIMVANEVIKKGLADGFMLVCIVPSLLSDQYRAPLKTLASIVRESPQTEVVVGEIVAEAFVPLSFIRNSN